MTHARNRRGDRTGVRHGTCGVRGQPGRRPGGGRGRRRVPARSESGRPVGRDRRSRGRPTLGARHPAGRLLRHQVRDGRVRAPARPARGAGPRRTRRGVLAGVRGEREGAHSRPLAAHPPGRAAHDRPPDHSGGGDSAASAPTWPRRSRHHSGSTCGSGCRRASTTGSICTARALARFYAALIGEVDGHRILAPSTLAAATAEQTSGIDRILRMPVRIGTGFGLPTPDAYWYSPTAFGFPGYGGSIGFADPATGLAFAYVMNHVQEGVPDRRAATLLDAVRTSITTPARGTDPDGRS